MEKTMSRKNIFSYISDFFRSIGSSAKTLIEEEQEEKVEGLEAFDEKTLSKEDAETLKTLLASQKGAVADIELAQEKRTHEIDYPDEGKKFKNSMATEEIEEEEPKKVKGRAKASTEKERSDD